MALAIAVTCVSSAKGDIVSFLNTPGGLYSSGLPGSAYTVSGPGLAGTIPAVTGTPGNFPLNVYPVTTPISQWLLTQPNPGGLITNQVGQFQFSTSFTLPSSFSSAIIIGRLSVDNALVDVRLNGVSIPGAPTGGGFPAFVPLSITGGFSPGVNTLDFFVNNQPPANAGNPVAFNAQFAVAEVTTLVVPEPTTLLLLSGLLTCGVVHARRVRRAG